MNVQTLKQYIKDNHKGNGSDFAKAHGVASTQANDWRRRGFMLIDGVIYSPRRRIKTNGRHIDLEVGQKLAGK